MRVETGSEDESFVRVCDACAADNVCKAPTRRTSEISDLFEEDTEQFDPLLCEVLDLK